MITAFKEISGWVYDATGIEIPLDLIRFDVYQNHRGDKVLAERIGLFKIEGQLRKRLMRWVNVTTEELKHRGVGSPPYFMH